MIQWGQRRTIGDDEGDEAKAKSSDGDNGETQEMKKTTMEEGRIAPSMRDDEGREGSYFNGYLYLVQDIYMNREAGTASQVSETTLQS